VVRGREPVGPSEAITTPTRAPSSAGRVERRHTDSSRPSGRPASPNIRIGRKVEVAHNTPARRPAGDTAARTKRDVRRRRASSRPADEEANMPTRWAVRESWAGDISGGSASFNGVAGLVSLPPSDSMVVISPIKSERSYPSDLLITGENGLRTLEYSFSRVAEEGSFTKAAPVPHSCNPRSAKDQGPGTRTGRATVRRAHAPMRGATPGRGGRAAYRPDCHRWPQRPRPPPNSRRAGLPQRRAETWARAGMQGHLPHKCGPSQPPNPGVGCAPHRRAPARR